MSPSPRSGGLITCRRRKVRGSIWTELEPKFGPPDETALSHAFNALMSTFFTEATVARELLVWHGHAVKKRSPAFACEIVPDFLRLRRPTDAIVRTVDRAEVGSSVMEGAARFFASR